MRIRNSIKYGRVAVILALVGVLCVSTFSFTSFGGTLANLTLWSQDSLNSGLLAHWTMDGPNTNASSTPEATASYGFYRAITLEQEMVTGGSDFTDFPVLISEMRNDLRVTGSGGDVTSSSGYDIIFTSDTSCETQLDHEIERYVSTTGEFVAWVRVPTLGATVDTTIYMCYGNSSVTTSQEDIPGTWNSSYVGVWHMNGDSTRQLDSASTTVRHDATVSGATSGTSGKIGTAYDFDGVNDVLTITDEAELDLTTAGTFEAWMETDDVNGSEANFSTWVTADAPNGWDELDSSGFDMVIVGENMYYGSHGCNATAEVEEVASSTLSGSVFRSWVQGTNLNWNLCTAAEGGQLAVDSDGVHLYYYAVSTDTTTETPYLATSTIGGTFGTQVTQTTQNPPGIGASDHGGVDMIMVGNNLYMIAIEPADAAETIATTTLARGTIASPTWRSHASPTTALTPAATQGCNAAVDSDGSRLFYTAYCHAATPASNVAETYASASSTVDVTTPITWFGETAPDGMGSNEIGGIDIVFVGGRILHAAAFATSTTAGNTETFSTASSSASSGGTLTWIARSGVNGAGTIDGTPSDVAVESDGKNVYYAAVYDSNGTETLNLASSTLPAHPFLSKDDAYEMIQVGTGYHFDWPGKPYGFGTSTAVNTYKHVVVSYDGTTLNMYENGVLRRTQNTSANGTSVSFTANTNDLRIGSGFRSVGTQIYFDGGIDEVRVSSAARSADWILTQYNNQNSTTTFYTVGTENTISSGGSTEVGSAHTVLDVSGNGNHASSTRNQVIATAPGRIGQAIKFNGVDDYLKADEVDEGVANNVKTVAFWVKLATTTASNKILMHLDTSDADYIEYTSGSIAANGFTATNIYVDGSTASAAISDLGWHHVVVTQSTGLNADNFYMGTTTNHFGGFMDDVRVYNRVLSADEITRLYGLGGTTKVNTTINTQPNLMSGLVGWWTFDGKDMSIRASSNQVTDRSGQDNPGSITGMGSGTTTVAGIIGQALYFDGIDDLVTVADATELDLGSSDVTVSFWAKTASTTSDRMIVMNKRTDGNDKEFEFAIRSTNRDLVYECENAGGGGSATSEDNVWDINTWFHGVIVVDRATFTPTFYVNGKAVTLESNTVNSCDTPSNAIVRIGARTSTTNLLDARLDDVRLYNRKLSMAEVTQLYQLGGTTKLNTTIISNQGLNTGLAGHWTFDGKDIDFSTSNVTSEVRDRSGNGIHLDMRDHASTTAPGRIGQSIPFDGNVFMQYTTSDGDALDLDSAYTISMWMKRSDTAGGTAQTVIRRGANSGTDSLSQYEIALDETTGAITVRHGDGSTSQDISIGNITEADGWTHLVCTKASAQLTCYKNGSLFSGPTAITIGAYAGTEATFLIGSVLNSGNSKYGGKLDDVRVYNRALGVDEIKRLYDLGK